MSSTFDLLFRTDDLTRWGEGKGVPLNAAEVDSNFWILLKLYLALEENPIQPKQITDISVSGNALTVMLSDASTFGPFALPVATFNWRGNWQPNTDYAKFDVFTETSGLYLVLQDITSDSIFDPTASTIAGDEYKLMIAFPVSFDIGFFFPGQPGTGIIDSNPIFSYRAARPFFLNAGLPDTVAGVDVAFTVDSSFPIQQNGTVIGSIDFAAGFTTPTFSFAADVQFVANDILKVMKPASIDATAMNLTVTIAAIKGLESSSS